MHLVFYDGECHLCDQVVHLLLKVDHLERFVFASLQGTTAAKLLKDLPEKYKKADSLILVENYQTSQQRFFILGKGVLRIFWLLGGLWKILGIFSFLPSFLYSWAYRQVAHDRYRVFGQTCLVPSTKDKHRFLP